MLSLKVGNKQISINLDNRVFSDLGDSGTGKTYLYKLLVSAESLDELDICVITYDKNRDMVEYVLQKLRGQYRFIFLDRYDKYCCDTINRELLKATRNCPILLDLKNVNRIKDYRVYSASVELTEEGVNVNGEIYI